MDLFLKSNLIFPIITEVDFSVLVLLLLISQFRSIFSCALK